MSRARLSGLRTSALQPLALVNRITLQKHTNMITIKKSENFGSQTYIVTFLTHSRSCSTIINLKTFNFQYLNKHDFDVHN